MNNYILNRETLPYSYFYPNSEMSTPILVKELSLVNSVSRFLASSAHCWCWPRGWRQMSKHMLNLKKRPTFNFIIHLQIRVPIRRDCQCLIGELVLLLT
jgi:hypothetical protein